MVSFGSDEGFELKFGSDKGMPPKPPVKRESQPKDEAAPASPSPFPGRFPSPPPAFKRPVAPGGVTPPPTKAPEPEEVVEQEPPRVAPKNPLVQGVTGLHQPEPVSPREDVDRSYITEEDVLAQEPDYYQTPGPITPSRLEPSASRFGEDPYGDGGEYKPTPTYSRERDLLDDDRDRRPAPRRIDARDEEEDDEEEASHKGRGRGRKAAPKPRSRGKKERPPKKPAFKDYRGDRWKVITFRIVVGIVAAIVVVNGLSRILLPANGPTKAQVQAAALEAVGDTGFPATEGASFAQSFTATYLNFSTADREQREAALLNFGPEEFILKIDVTANRTGNPGDVELTEEQYASLNQEVTDGPYLVRAVSLDETHATFITKAELNNSSWVYLEVPVVVNEKANTMNLAGPVSFSSPTEVGKLTEQDYIAKWTDDKVVSDLIREDLENYLTAWAVSDQTKIARYITKDATVAARQGLQGSADFNRLDLLSTQTSTSENGIAKNKRLIEFSVVWKIPESPLYYTQTYRAVIEYDGERWYISDIQNPSMLPDETSN